MHSQAIQWYLDEVKQVQNEFVSASVSNDTPQGSNLPPVSCRLVWCRGLLQRVQGPLREVGAALWG